MGQVEMADRGADDLRGFMPRIRPDRRGRVGIDAAGLLDKSLKGDLEPLCLLELAFGELFPLSLRMRAVRADRRPAGRPACQPLRTRRPAGRVARPPLGTTSCKCFLLAASGEGNNSQNKTEKKDGAGRQCPHSASSLAVVSVTLPARRGVYEEEGRPEQHAAATDDRGPRLPTLSERDATSAHPAMFAARLRMVI